MHSPEGRRAAPASGASRPPIRVLLIEDDQAEAGLVQTELEHRQSHAFTVLHKDRLADALEALRGASFDAVVLDLNLPDSWGLRTYDRVHAAAPSLPVVILSGRSDEALATRAVLAGAQDYLVKGQGDTRSLGRAVRYAIERVRAEQSLRESEERFRATFEQAAVGIAHVGIDGRFVRVNDRLCEMTGYSREELTTLTFAEVAATGPTGPSPGAAHPLHDLAQGPTPVERPYHRKDGEVFWALLVNSLVRGDDGEPKYFISVLEDVTARKMAVEALRQSQATLQTIFDAAPLAILSLELDGRVTEWNAGAERMFGWTPAEAIGTYCPTVPPNGREEFERMIARVAADGSQTGMAFEQRTRDGGRIQANISASPITDGAGRTVGVIAMAEDVTARRELEQQVLRAQRLESIGTLAGGIAHDLNNVLTPILMSVELLQQGETDRKRLNVLAAVEASARRGADMVGQVLSFARGVEGRRQLVHADELLEDIRRLTEETFLKHIRVRATHQEGLWTVSGDPTQLHQVLLNLCLNARDAMPGGGTLSLIARNVEIRAHDAGQTPDARSGPHVVLQVRDTGTGMPDWVQDKIFDPFFTTKEVGKGTGLGLSTTMAIVRSHGGFMRVQSEPGQGSTFSVYLPAAVAVEAAGERRARSAHPRGNGELVLVVDDEPSVLQVTRETLEAFGYRTLTAPDGAEAIALYTRHRGEVRAVLTDMMMPGMDGRAMVRVLSKLDPLLPIIAASGLDTNLQVGGGRGDVADFLMKPYSADELLSALQRVLVEPV